MKSFLTESERPLVFKALLIMKMTTALILFFTMYASAEGFSQKKISLNLKRTEIATVLSTIEQQTDYRFLYNNNIRGITQKVNLNVADADIKTVLDELFSSSRLSYHFMENNLIVIREGELSLQAAAPMAVIRGKVMSDSGTPLADVSVMIKGSGKGTATNSEGEFSINANKGDVLLISYIGYETKEVTVGDQSSLSIVLTQTNQQLADVVVVGYGRQRKSDVTGSVTTVTAKDISYQASANPAQALQGKVAGLQVTTLGTPGSQPTIRVRGVGSASSNVDPLYVVDGVLTNDITFLGNNDIESISVLKDASASAIYGIRAGNGVIIITTKRGKNGQPRVSYAGYGGIQKPVKMVKLATGSEYIQLLNEKDAIDAARSGGTPPVPRNPANYPSSTNWYDEILRSNALIQSHEVNFSGGTEKTQYALGSGYFKQEGLAKTNDYQRINVRTNVDSKVTNFLKVGINANISGFTSNNLPDNMFMSAYTAPSALPVKNSDGTYSDMTQFGAFANPVAKLEYNRDQTRGIRMVGGVYAELYLAKGLTFKSAYGIDGTYSQNRIYVPRYVISSVQRDTTQKLTKKVEDPFSYYWDNTLTYDFAIANDHRFTVLLGTNIQQERGHSLTASRLGVPDLGSKSWYLNLGDPTTQTSDESVTLYRAASVFGRLNYSFKNRYLLTATLRRDAASIFPLNNRVDYFPSVGLGWVVSQEEFMADQNIFNFLKVRGSWGRMGNSKIPATVVTAVSTGGAYSQPGQVGAGVDQVGPTNLLWETADEIDIAIEGAALKSRLTFEIDYYNKKTNNSIFNVTVLSPVGASNTRYLDNNAGIRNQGVELNLGWKDKAGEFNYSINGNFSYNKNRVESLRPGTIGIYSGAVNFITTTYTTVGHPIGEFYGRQVIGIFQNQSEINGYKTATGTTIQPDAQPGDFKFADVNGDGKITDADRTFLGSAIPTYNFGFSLYGAYKGFDLTIDLYGQGGNKVYNARRFRQLGNENYDQIFYEKRWHGEGTSYDYPSADLATNANKLSNSWYVESGNFVKVRNLQIGYTFSEKVTSRMKLAGLRIYANATNPFNFFKYTGFNPEVTIIDNKKAANERFDATSQGIDYNVYPMFATFNFGVNVNL
ncbi:TonB-dependent receptor [Filimonas effusa]|nr:TonB-dependent receptor [Filimonas effusa]